jgi:hypothetical protein
MKSIKGSQIDETVRLWAKNKNHHHLAWINWFSSAIIHRFVHDGLGHVTFFLVDVIDMFRKVNLIDQGKGAHMTKVLKKVCDLDKALNKEICLELMNLK